MFSAKVYELGPASGAQRERSREFPHSPQFHEGGRLGARGGADARPRAFAAEPLKVGFVYLGPIGDYGWTWAHTRAAGDGRSAQRSGHPDYVENVKEDASATPIIKDLAQTGPSSSSRRRSAIWIRRSKPPSSSPTSCSSIARATSTCQPRHLQFALPSGPSGRGHDRWPACRSRGHRLSRLLQGAGGGAGRERLHACRAGGQPEDQD